MSWLELFGKKVKAKDIGYPDELTIYAGDRFFTYWDTYGQQYIPIGLAPFFNKLKAQGYTKAVINFGAEKGSIYHEGTRYTRDLVSYYSSDPEQEFDYLCSRGAFSIATLQSSWGSFTAAMYVDNGVSITISK